MKDYIAYAHQAGDVHLDDDIRRRAFSKLVHQFQNMAYACALGLLGDPNAAEDAVQDTFISAWRYLHRLKNPAAFPSWIRRRVIWHCYYYAQSRPQIISYSDDMIAQMVDETDLESTTIQNDLNQKVRQLIKALPRNAREILTLYYLNEYSVCVNDFGTDFIGNLN